MFVYFRNCILQTIYLINDVPCIYLGESTTSFDRNLHVRSSPYVLYERILLINIPISVRIAIKSIVYHIVTVSFRILGIRASVFTIVCTIIIIIDVLCNATLYINILLLVVFFKFLITTTPSFPTTKSFVSSCEKEADDTFPALVATPKIPSPRSLYCSRHSEKFSTE